MFIGFGAIKVDGCNAFLMGLHSIYFVVLSPTGFSVTVEPYDDHYARSSLLPALLNFWHNHVVPAFREREALDGA